MVQFTITNSVELVQSEYQSVIMPGDWSALQYSTELLTVDVYDVNSHMFVFSAGSGSCGFLFE